MNDSTQRNAIDIQHSRKTKSRRGACTEEGESRGWRVMDGMPTVLALHPNEASTYVRNGNTQTKIQRYRNKGRGESRLGHRYIPRWSVVNALIGWTLPITVETMGRGALSAFTLISVNYRNFPVRTLLRAEFCLFATIERIYKVRLAYRTPYIVYSVYSPIYLYSCSIYISTLYNQCLDFRVRYMRGTWDGTSLK